MDKIEKISGEEILKDLEYLKLKRDDALEHFVDTVKGGEALEIIESRYQALLRKEKQMRTLEDALIIYRVIRNQIGDESKLG
jgi:hypothetical protein